MKLKIKLGENDATTIEAAWHPTWQVGVRVDTFIRPAGLWTTDAAIRNHLEEINRVRGEENIRKRDLSDIDSLIQNIVCGEAPVEVYRSSENDEPWKCTGNLMKEIPYGDVYD